MRPQEWALNNKPQSKEFWSRIGPRESERSKLRDFARDRLKKSKSMLD